ncbi:MAG: SDR family NAD(P)-dependent oxidoreductase [Alphaproteobacteria bacterium]|nr:SDR family NAD(P)-dependent oxidoreductase [Alphaproteobacteria bacterium]
MLFAGKKIWIIGASSGIGMALAHQLAAQGALLALSARREAQLNALLQELGDNNYNQQNHITKKHLICPLDVAKADKIANAAGSIIAHFESLDSVIFLPAIYSTDEAEKKSLAHINQAIDINLRSVFYVLDAVLPQFEQQKSGQLILCSSVAGYKGLPNGQPYCATKAALLNLAESLKIDLEPKNIDVKVITPGFVKTELTDKNNFKMPMLITPVEAATHIIKGMGTKKFEIHFPKKFTLIMKLINLLPYGLYFALMRSIKKKMSNKA